MGLGIHKPGQGYWVRVMTAVFLGVLALAASGWMWQQAGAITLPKKSWTVTVSEQQGSLQAGAEVRLLRQEGELGSPPVEAGQAIVDEVEGTRLVLSGIKMNRDADSPTANMLIRVGTADTQTFGAMVESARGNPIFPQIYVQAGAIAVLILFSAAGIYWFVGLKRNTVDFLIATDGEMKKVNWSTRKDVYGSTVVILVASTLIVIGLFSVDLVFAKFFQFVGVLE